MSRITLFLVIYVNFLNCYTALLCGPNEVQAVCPHDCPSDFCQTEYSPPQLCRQTRNCLIIGCKCKPNYKYVSRENKTCIPADECLQKTCPDNQVLIECPHDCPGDYCPTKNNQSEACIYSNICRVNGAECKCAFNNRYISKQNKTCIPTRSCPPFACGENEVYDSCPNYCSEDCDNASPDGNRCRNKGVILAGGNSNIVVNCKPACRCIDNYWRNDAKKCVPYSECPPRCSDSETLVECPRDCPSDYCPTSKDESQDCGVNTDICLPSACKCRFNYRYASPTNKTCIPTRDCPPFACGCNEQYNPCPSYCSDSCQDANPNGTRCTNIIGHILVSKIVVDCVPACKCIDKYWRNENKKCVSYDDCFENCD